MHSGILNLKPLSLFLDGGVSPKVWPVSGVLMRFFDGFEWQTRFP